MQLSPRLQKPLMIGLEILTGIFISLLLLAVLPLLVQKVTGYAHEETIELSQLIPLEEDVPPPDDLPKPDLPEPPKPEITPPDPPEIEPPDMMPPEEMIEQPTDVVPSVSLEVEMPTLATDTALSLQVQAPSFNKALTPHMAPKFSDQKVFDMKELDKQPQYLSPMQPPYPYKARRLGIEGYVDVRFLVDVNGRPHKLSILRAKPEGEFEESVKKTVPQWRFKPGQKGGRPVNTWVKTRIMFQLN